MIAWRCIFLDILAPMKLSNPFLSEDDLDLKSLSWEELQVVWTEWLRAAQVSNHLDEDTYSHGVFQLVREPRIKSGPSEPPTKK